MNIHSSLLRKVLAYPGRLQVHRQVMMASIGKQFVPLDDEDNQIVVPEYTEHIPRLHGLYLRTAFMLWNGWNLEDAAVLSRSAAGRMGTNVIRTEVITTTSKPELHVEVGDRVRKGTILATWELDDNQIQCGYPRRGDRNLLCATGPVPGMVKSVECYTESRSGSIVWNTKVNINSKYYMTVGSKISNLHASKSTISRIVGDNYMPHDMDGRPVDLLVSPYAIPRRMAPSTIMEMMLTTYILELRRILGKDVSMVLDPYDSNLSFEGVAGNLAAMGLPPDQMVQLRNGKWGSPYRNRTLVGPMYVGRVSKHPQDMMGYNNQMLTNFRGSPVRGIGTQRLGREEVEVLIQYGATGLIKELVDLQRETNTIDRISDLVGCLGYEVE